MPRAAGILPICCRRLPCSEPPAREAQAPTEGIGYTQGGSRGGQVGILLEQQTVPSGLGESGGLSASHPPASLGRGRGNLEWRNQTGISRLLQPKGVVGSFPCLTAPRLGVWDACPRRCARSWPCCDMEPSIALTFSELGAAGICWAEEAGNFSRAGRESRYQDKSICDQTASESQLPALPTSKISWRFRRHKAPDPASWVTKSYH